MMTYTVRAVAQVINRRLGRPQAQTHRLDQHLRGVFPSLGLQPHRAQRRQRRTAHPAMDIGKMRAVNQIQNRARQGCAEVPMQRRHRAGFDSAGKARSHDELAALLKLLNKAAQFAEIIGAIGVAHQHVPAAHKGNRVDIGPSEPAPGRPEHACASGKGDLPRAIARAVDNNDFGGDPRLVDSHAAPVEKFPDHGLFVHRGDHH